MRNDSRSGNSQVSQVKRLTQELRRVNSRIRSLMGQLPLADHTKIAELARLVGQQIRLLEAPFSRSSQLEAGLLEKERESAVFLRQWYKRELWAGRLRKRHEE